MASLFIDLQDGFHDDTVTVRVDGRQVYHKQHVSTDLRISRADSIATEVPEGTVTITCDVTTKGLSQTQTVHLATTLYVGLTIAGGTIEVRTSDQPFFYM